MKTGFAILCWIGLASLPAFGGEIYKWIDNEGKVHYGDRVPDQYKKRATVPDLPEIATVDLSSPPVPQLGDVYGDSGLSAGRSRLQDDDVLWSSGVSETDASDAACEAKMQRYRESQACFAPYRLANGAIKAEAFEHCTAIPQPPCYLNQ